MKLFNHCLNWGFKITCFLVYLNRQQIIMKRLICQLFIALMLFTGLHEVSAQTYHVTDIRLTLMMSGSEIESAVKLLFDDPEFLALIHDTVRVTLKEKLKSDSVLIDLQSIVLIHRLTTKPYNYKSKGRENKTCLIILESNMGLTEVSKNELYEISTNIKVLNPKKKKIAKSAFTVEIGTEDVNPEENTLIHPDKNAFITAYIKSLTGAIISIGEIGN